MTDRRIRSTADMDTLNFDERGLVPVVAQDDAGARVLMVAWANRDALARTVETGEVHFWSRSRGEIWRKGETSGNVLRLLALYADCDGDTVLALVRPSGPACHTGDVSCFGDGATPTASGTLQALWSVIEERASTLPEESYTTRLLGDENLRLKKLGEETAELIVALTRTDRERVPEEAADLLYHLLAALKGAGVELSAVLDALEERRR
ncbi:MAG: bifunctional phosphoribosyl-AMP cyclohydrolase/phosphoribosyl-ATP diphosphatase HisIE [Gemmatimonadota bacterium]|nr:bifunctional phosphoribosyl-AMP cyclohydrolase/phosphoribosyl-ATP diphosphatase HisIE [Gemmatimonadota bacterium]